MGVAATIILASTVYLYLPIATKIERGSVMWFLGLLTTISLFVLGTVLSGLWTHWIYMIPATEEAWGDYISDFAILALIIHGTARKQDKDQDKPRETIP